MLVLSRRLNESVMIGHDVVITVVEVRGDQVRLGIQAPREIQVHREEVYLAIQLANQAAAGSARHADPALLTGARVTPSESPRRPPSS